jgi:hypothetical protein
MHAWSSATRTPCTDLHGVDLGKGTQTSIRTEGVVSQGLSGKWIEVLILALAGVGFVVWQLRDVNRALERSRAERLAREARERDARDAGDPPQEPPPS